MMGVSTHLNKHKKNPTIVGGGTEWGSESEQRETGLKTQHAAAKI